jgi:glycosyltransferase involved in cell wall biosynthesis
MSKALVTALIDTYNHERYIEQAIVSVVEQGLSAAELEILVVDDGSTDGTAGIIQKFAPRVKHLRKKNGGQASAFNAAWPEIKGEIVAMLDGDDWWAAGKVAAVLGAFEERPEMGAVSHGYTEFREETRENKVWTLPEETSLSLGSAEAARETFRAWRYLVTSALTVRKSVLERVMPIPEALVFSADAPIALAAAAAGTLVLKEPYSFYRQHGESLYAAAAKDRFSAAVAQEQAKLRRRCEMDETLFDVLGTLLGRLGVREKCVAQLLDSGWVNASRLSLRTFGGSRLKTLRTEMRAFRSEFKKPGLWYRLFKYLGVGGATLVLPPKQFYEARDWYAQNNFQRLRERFVKAGNKPLPTRSK